MEQNEVVGKISGTAVKWGKLARAWCVSFVKTRAYGLRLRKARKELDSVTARLGMEFYSLHRRGETDIVNSIVILQQLKIVEEAEFRVLELQGRIDGACEEFRKKKEQIYAGQELSA